MMSNPDDERRTFGTVLTSANITEYAVCFALFWLIGTLWTLCRFFVLIRNSIVNTFQLTIGSRFTVSAFVLVIAVLIFDFFFETMPISGESEYIRVFDNTDVFSVLALGTQK